MATVLVYNKEGVENGSMEISDAIFGIKVRNALIHQVYHALEANSRQPWADTKDKSEVRGGGRKPWKQKGTGRARHGSNRSPIWSGGGVTFGPLSIRNYKEKINKKMRRLAVCMALSGRVQEAKLIVVEEFPADGKTKTFSKLLSALPGKGKSTLLVDSQPEESLGLAMRNIPKANLQEAKDIHVVDILHHAYIVTSKKAIKALEDRLGA